MTDLSYYEHLADEFAASVVLMAMIKVKTHPAPLEGTDVPAYAMARHAAVSALVRLALPFEPDSPDQLPKSPVP